MVRIRARKENIGPDDMLVVTPAIRVELADIGPVTDTPKDWGQSPNVENTVADGVPPTGADRVSTVIADRANVVSTKVRRQIPRYTTRKEDEERSELYIG